MKTLYATNGLVFWTENEIRTRRMLEEFYVRSITACLKDRQLLGSRSSKSKRRRS
jgi:hypothetical protein